MNRRIPIALFAFLSTLNFQPSTLCAQGTAFTYQGRLNSGGNAANGNYDFMFALFSGAGQVGATLINLAVPVSNGLFTVVLDFDANFPGADRWLEISVRTNGTGALTTLVPRQKLTPAPYAIYSANAANAAQLGGQSPGAYVAKSGDTMTGPLQVNSNLGVDGGITAGDQMIGHSYAFDGSGSGIHGYGARVGTIGTGSRGVIGESDNNTGVYGESVVGTGVEGASTSASASGWGVYGHSQNNTGVYGQSQTATGVEGASTTGWGVHGHSQNNTGVYGRTDIAGPTLAGVFGDNGADGGTGVVGRGLANNSAGVAGVADGVNTTGVYGRGTTWAGNFDGNVRVGCALTIAGGCDVSEPFKMSAQEIPKGAVMVIDDEHPGQLKMSERAYDTRVAGIVSGANGIKPGISLSQQGAIEGGQNIALCGRVYVLADASSGPIKPGDLLTTSDTPGHAMRVADHSRTQGAIIGKAMSSLGKDCGLVLVLVTLQ